MTRYVLDTNLLVYAVDGADPAKQRRALETIERVGRTPSAAVPAQALAEFSRVVTGRLRPPLPPEAALRQGELYERVFPVLPLTAVTVREALRGVGAHGFSYFDAQIWAVAREHQIGSVLSEDFASGATVGGVTFLNPMDLAFDLAAL